MFVTLDKLQQTEERKENPSIGSTDSSTRSAIFHARKILQIFLNIQLRVRWLLTFVAVQPWRCLGILHSAPLAPLSFLAAFGAIAQPTGDPFEKLQLCSSLNLSVLAPKNWMFLNGKRTTEVELSLPSVETLLLANELPLHTRVRSRFVA